MFLGFKLIQFNWKKMIKQNKQKQNKERKEKHSSWFI